MCAGLLEYAGHACPPLRHASLGRWLHGLRRSFIEQRLAADKVAALRAVGMEFDGNKARNIREEHEAPDPGKDAEEVFEEKLEELKEYKRRHGATLHRMLADIPVAVVGPCAALSGALPRLAVCMLRFQPLIREGT
jgi:hypothetical protein